MSGCPVVVSGPVGEADITLPDDVPVASLLPALSLAYAGVDAQRVIVLVAGEVALDHSRSLAQLAVRPGAVLNLFPRDALPSSSLAVATPTCTRAPAAPAGIVHPLIRTGRKRRALPAPPPDLAPTPVPTAVRWRWRGAHGGAGVTTLRRALGGIESGAESDSAIGIPNSALPIVVVARTHADGLQAAQRLALELGGNDDQGDGIVAGLVLVPDAPDRLPPALCDLAQVVGGGYRRTWHLGWHDELRFGLDPSRRLPRPIRQLGRDLAALTALTALTASNSYQLRREV